ncbi:MAG: glutathione S-transferase [Rhodobacteraceae bacterium]|nr:MAG: glutathione S-transferase [Paracoccaceae bacterium]
MPDTFPLPVTATTAFILGALLLLLTLKVVVGRRTKHIVLGDNDDRIFTKHIRGHGNAAEQIPMALILLGFVEYLQAPSYALIIATVLIVGRFMHAAYFSFHGTHWRFRYYGMLLTIIAQGLALIALLYALVT